MIWFTSDLHLGHSNVLRFTDRPWDTVAEMNEALVGAINERVAPDDELWVLGDFSYRMSLADARAAREAILCRNVHLVPGNHDRNWETPEAAGTFLVEPPIAQVKFGGRRLVCSHFPMMDWAGLGHGSVHLHGHIHSSPEYNLSNRERGLLRYDVGVDANGDVPVSAEQVLAFFDGVEHRHRVSWRDWPALGDDGPAGLAAGDVAEGAD